MKMVSGWKWKFIRFRIRVVSAHVLQEHAKRWWLTKKVSEVMEKLGSYVMPGTQQEKSAVYVPLITGDQARGLIPLVNMEHEHAFSDSDVRLFETMANSMGVALENARLFDETQRLLKETEQRAAELAAVNTVSSALASELDLNALINLVGEQTRAIFNADIAYVALLDEASSRSTSPTPTAKN